MSRPQREAFRLTVEIKGATRDDVRRALSEVRARLILGERDGAESTDTMAYVFKLKEVLK